MGMFSLFRFGSQSVFQQTSLDLIFVRQQDLLCVLHYLTLVAKRHFGYKPGILGIESDGLSQDFLVFVLLGKEYKSSKVPFYKLQKLRYSLFYWHPMDLRFSAKDLIKNHLIMCLLNHTAIWEYESDKWPRGFQCNDQLWGYPITSVFHQVYGQDQVNQKESFKTKERR